MAKLRFTVVLLGNSDLEKYLRFLHLGDKKQCDSVIFRLSQGAKYFVPSDYGM